MLSHNFYESPACMNEMGAAWVKTTDHLAVLIPPFMFSDVKGAINPRSNMVRINDTQKLNTFRDEIIKTFNLPDVNMNIWERDRDGFLAAIEPMLRKDVDIRKAFQISVEKLKAAQDGSIEVDLRLINNAKEPIKFTQIILVIKDNYEQTIEETIDPKLFNEIVIYSNERTRKVFRLNKQLDYDFSEYNVIAKFTASEVY